jgi:hypothetical protein
MEIFQNSFLKLCRAKHHIQELQATLDPYFSDSPIVVTETYVVPTADGFEGGGKAEYKALPKMTGPIIGDIIHNLRACLDLMASDLAVAVSGTSNGVYFPFAAKADELDGQIKRKRFELCGSDAVDILKTLQPYKGGNVELRAIHDLDILDKHQAVLPNPQPKHKVFELKFERDASGQDLACVEVPTVPEVELVFAKNTGLDGRELIQTLKELVELCETILERFVALHPVK